MMACVADRVVAAPFAMVGSIGVVAQMPNVHKLLKKNDVDFMIFTAGKYKRTITPVTENTEEAKAKFQSELDAIHDEFRSHVYTNRDACLEDNSEDVATGEAWLAMQALEKGLVDELMTSDEYIRSLMRESDVIEVKAMSKKPSLIESWQQGMADAAASIRSLSPFSSQFDAEQSWTPPSATAAGHAAHARY